MKKIYTIGHSTLSIQEFLLLLKCYDIKTLVDIRRFPSSRKYPQFNEESIKESLKKLGIKYIHLIDLGGRRKVRKNSKNNSWRNTSFKAYADYMETDDFENAVTELERIAANQTTAYMCAEALWWRCHRSMVSDYLKAKGWEVLHILTTGKTQEHAYTAPAKIIGTKISYADETQLEIRST